MNDYFDLDYVAHELGHQFGAFHTFSHEMEGAGVNSEPGSGSTIMGYAGITGLDNVALHGDPYFHYYSIKNKGLGGFLAELTFQPYGKWMAPINVIFEIPGFYAKQLALGLRLYGNLFAGEMIFILIALFFGGFFSSITGVLAGVAGLVLNFIWAVFHILVVILQAFLFMVLTLVYLQQAHEHH